MKSVVFLWMFISYQSSGKLSQIICERQALMGYQSITLQSGHFSDLNASIPYPAWLQVDLPATSLFHLAPVFSLKVP